VPITSDFRMQTELLDRLADLGPTIGIADVRKMIGLMPTFFRALLIEAGHDDIAPAAGSDRRTAWDSGRPN